VQFSLRRRRCRRDSAEHERESARVIKEYLDWWEKVAWATLVAESDRRMSEKREITTGGG
jgi:hypothetical protein